MRCDAGGMAGGTNYRAYDTGIDEFRAGESAYVTFDGIPKTTMTLQADLEQRRLNVDETANIQSHEIFTVYAAPEGWIIREADIDFNDFTITYKGTTRLLDPLKITTKYRYKDRERDYEEDVDNMPLFYPGRLGDIDIETHETSLFLDLDLSSKWKLSFREMYCTNEIGFSRTTSAAQDLDVWSHTLTASGQVFGNLMATAMGSIQDYYLETQTDVPSSNDWRDGTYNYDGDSWMYSFGFTYLFNSRTSASVNHSHRDVNGFVNNELDRVSLEASHTLGNGASKLTLGGEWFDFDDQSGEGFDSYDGFGVTFAFEHEF